MEKLRILLISSLLLTNCLIGSRAYGQRLHMVSAATDSIWAIDTTAWSIAQRVKATMTGTTITGIQGLAFDPIGHDVFGLVTTTGQPNASILAQTNLATGVCTQVGNLGQSFAGIAFREDGQLVGVVADSDANAEKLYLIDKANGTTILATALGNGDAGEAISYRHDDQLLYHWSGNNLRIMEKLPATAPYSPVTNVPMTGAANAEVSAATYLGNGRFLLGNTTQDLQYVFATGLFLPPQMNLPFPASGLVFAPQFALSDDFFCVFDTISWNFGGIALDTVVYDWGDGTVESVFPAASRSHSYSIPGNYVTTASLKNATSGLDQMGVRNIQVKPLPPVSLNPGQDTVLCLADTLMITGSFGGTSQWYRNGSTISGANTNVHFATQNGWYNMTKRNQNGCIDSAAVGFSVIFATQTPTPMISVDTTDCPTLLFNSNDPIGNTWNWTFGDGSTGTGSNPSHTYSSIGTFTIGLVASNECFSASASSTAMVDCFIGLENSNAPHFAIVPNPNNGTFLLNAQMKSPSTLTFSLMDANGRIILQEKHFLGNHEWTQRIQLNAPKGIYLLRWQAGTSSGNQRIVIQ
ncbi:MAG: PKD domain-containing protein [Bacteroidetes bacterium]|nr:PKD domain-containing protein [Bacteroidota bacterium]